MSDAASVSGQPEASADPAVRLDRDGALAVLTLDRPRAMNSLSVAAKEQLLAAVTEVAADDSVRAVLLTGSGRAFSAGQDLREHVALLESGGDPAATVREHYNPICLGLATMPKPVVACVNGVAAGAGASLALACDLRVAAAAARFIMAFAQVGMGADTGASWTLQRLVGLARATELLLLAQPLDAEQALALGLVSSVEPDETALAAATELAGRLAAGPTVAYAAIKAQLAASTVLGLADALAVEARHQAVTGASADHRAACEAFLTRTAPSFTGR